MDIDQLASFFGNLDPILLPITAIGTLILAGLGILARYRTREKSPVIIATTQSGLASLGP